MSAPASPYQTVVVGSAVIAYAETNRANVRDVFCDGRQVGQMRPSGTGETLRWRAHRNGHGTSATDFPTQEQAAAAVGWRIQVFGYQVAHRRTAQREVRLVSPGGDIATIVWASTDFDQGLVFCTAIVSGDDIQAVLNEGGCAAVRRHVVAAFGVTCIGGGQRGTAGDPVVLFAMPADHKVTLHP